jgi:hypothetical protein
MGNSLHGGSVGQPGVGSSPGDNERWLKGALEVGCLPLSLYGNSVKGTWREGLLGTLKDRQKRLWKLASLSIGAPMGKLEGGSSTRFFERWMKGALGMECLSLSL